MFKKSILVLLKSGLKVIISFEEKESYEHNLDYLIMRYRNYAKSNENDVLTLFNDSGEFVYITTADILHIITLDTPEKQADLGVEKQLR